MAVVFWAVYTFFIPKRGGRNFEDFADEIVMSVLWPVVLLGLIIGGAVFIPYKLATRYSLRVCGSCNGNGVDPFPGIGGRELVCHRCDGNGYVRGNLP